MTSTPILKAGCLHRPRVSAKIVRERFGENTGDALAKKISDKMGDVFETMRDRFNRNGGDIGKLDNWGLPQTHNIGKIAKAGKEVWVNKAESLIDTRQYVHENGDYYHSKKYAHCLNIPMTLYQVTVQIKLKLADKLQAAGLLRLLTVIVKVVSYILKMLNHGLNINLSSAACSL